MNTRNLLTLALAAAALLQAPCARAATPYTKPPKEMLDVLHAPLPPQGMVSPTGDRLLLAYPVYYPPIAYIAQPMVRMAGRRMDVRTRSPHATSYFDTLELTDIPSGATRRIELPAGAKVIGPSWSADGRLVAFAVIADSSTELWVADAADAKARRIEGVALNPALGWAVRWMPDQRTLLVKTVPAGLGQAPQADEPPAGPDIQEAYGGKGPSSTYETRDTLKTALDEAMFDYYGASQLMLVDAAGGRAVPLGKPDMYTSVSPSPSGKYLRVERLHRPYSYVTTYDNFPYEAEVWDSSGNLVRKVASLPLADSVPIWGVPQGPREFRWAQDGGDTLYWAEALDGGSWKNKAPFRDRLMALRAPFAGEPQEVLKVPLRLEDVYWGENKGTAFVSDVNMPGHWTNTYIVDLDAPKPELRTLWSYSTDERYKNPGWPIFRTLPDGRGVVRQSGDYFFTSGQGSSPEGDRPFLDKVDIRTGKAERLFRSDKDAFEFATTLLAPDASAFLARRETPKDPPNYFVRTLISSAAAAEGEAVWASSSAAVTHIPDPAPALRAITKKLVRYKRSDGLDLSFTLYLPPGYKEGTRLPAVLWAYPLDYADPKMAAQVAGSDQRFTMFYGASELYYLLAGYAVIDNAQIPVVGNTDKMYDTYLKQLKAGAKAAVDKAVELGVVDRDRIGVSGHSHGGLMTANLLLHTALFQAGVARSGAYNRTLTAFGFQNERRTFWEAPKVYADVSAFFHADKLKRPLLLIHGAADQNPGTVPLQSQAMFEAVRGNGGTVKLMMLPYEAHGYSAMESIESVLAESVDWFDRYVKNAK